MAAVPRGPEGAISTGTRPEAGSVVFLHFCVGAVRCQMQKRRVALALSDSFFIQSMT
jgi:hypothetical protein